MAKIDVLDVLRAKYQTLPEFEFDSLMIPPMQMYLSAEDVDKLRRIATSLKLSAKIDTKYAMIDQIMRPRGFKRFSAGTNRVVYSYLEDTRFLVKIAVDKVGMQDNPREFENQFLLKPYCTKVFYVSPCGTVGFVERVLPIKNRAEFKEIAGDVFDMLVHKILGQYVMEDIGTKYFMNYGVRFGYGPCLLDFPYLYKLDGKKLYCSKVNPDTGEVCNGEIDYDIGFNHLVCDKCGKIYLASDLKDDTSFNKIIIKGGNEMKVTITKGTEIIASSIGADETMKKRSNSKPTFSNVVKAAIFIPNRDKEQNDSKPSNSESFKKKTNNSPKNKKPEYNAVPKNVNLIKATITGISHDHDESESSSTKKEHATPTEGLKATISTVTPDEDKKPVALKDAEELTDDANDEESEEETEELSEEDLVIAALERESEEREIENDHIHWPDEEDDEYDSDNDDSDDDEYSSEEGPSEYRVDDDNSSYESRRYSQYDDYDDQGGRVAIKRHNKNNNNGNWERPRDSHGKFTRTNGNNNNSKGRSKGNSKSRFIPDEE